MVGIETLLWWTEMRGDGATLKIDEVVNEAVREAVREDGDEVCKEFLALIVARGEGELETITKHISPFPFPCPASSTAPRHSLINWLVVISSKGFEERLLGVEYIPILFDKRLSSLKSIHVLDILLCPPRAPGNSSSLYC